MHTLKGYQGMVDGGKHIVEATWDDVSGILQLVNLYYSYLIKRLFIPYMILITTVMCPLTHVLCYFYTVINLTFGVVSNLF